MQKFSQIQWQTQNQSQHQKQQQKQVQKFSQMQIQGMNFLTMNSYDLRDEILKFTAENPFLKIISDTTGGEKLQAALENVQSHEETLQSHLLHQLNSMNLSDDERELSEKLIYNLDENGFYGSMLSPEFLLNRSRPAQNVAMLKRCIERIQKMDPVGTCCKGPEESLLVQARFSDFNTADGRSDVNELVLFILDGHLELLNPTQPLEILRKLLAFREQWHKKAFAPEIVLDNLQLSTELVSEALKFILSLNPRPAQDYVSDIGSEYNRPDVVVAVEKVSGAAEDDWERGIVAAGGEFHFRVKYASGVLPEVRLVQSALPKMNDVGNYEDFRKQSLQKATEFMNSLIFRESTVVLQACAIVSHQKTFFSNGIGPLNALTHRQIAKDLGIHESSVSRTANKKNSKFFQTDFGLFPASYFFSSGVSSTGSSELVSSVQVKEQIKNICKETSAGISDQKIADLLFEQGIKISRRTVNKYRNQLGIENSYVREK